ARRPDGVSPCTSEQTMIRAATISERSLRACEAKATSRRPSRASSAATAYVAFAQQPAEIGIVPTLRLTRTARSRIQSSREVRRRPSAKLPWRRQEVSDMNCSRRATAIRCALLLLGFTGAPCLLVPASHAQNLLFVSKLVGSNEVPPSGSAGTGAA